MHPWQTAFFFDLPPGLWQDLFAPFERVWDVLGQLTSIVNSRVTPEIQGNVHPLAVIEGAVSIGEGTIVEPGAYIKGPTIIGKHCEIRHGAYIRGGVLAGDKCVIGHTTEVKNAIFMDGAKAGHFAYIGDSILGRNVNLGAGTKLANLKMIAGNVQLKLAGKLMDSGLRKFGAILGDDVETGCNSVCSPGTMLGKQSMVYPCHHARGFHGPKSIVR